MVSGLPCDGNAAGTQIKAFLSDRSGAAHHLVQRAGTQKQAIRVARPIVSEQFRQGSSLFHQVERSSLAVFGHQVVDSQ